MRCCSDVLMDSGHINTETYKNAEGGGATSGSENELVRFWESKDYEGTIFLYKRGLVGCIGRPYQEEDLVMRRMAVLLMMGCLTFTAPAMAAETDVAGMDFSALSELKQKVDVEYHSRPEAEPFTIAAGYYTVGQDIKPGRYYVASVIPDEDGYGVRMHVYAEKAQFDSRPSGYYGDYISDDYFSLGDEPKSMMLEDGNYLYVEGSLMFSASEFNPSDYYTYEAPEGTYVPAGTYMVGEGDDKDIPAGTFTVYAGAVKGGDVKIYYSQEAFAEDGSWHLGYDQHCEVRVTSGTASETIVLEEGYVLLVESDVVMRKGSGNGKLEFD